MPDAVIDRDERGATVVLDGQPQSYVDLVDPGFLAFEYVQHLASVLDVLPAGPLAVTHVGGAGLTLPRYVQHTRPGSPQIVLEPDAALTDLVRKELPLPRGHRIRVRPVDGRSGVRALRDESADVIVLDAYAGGRMPAELATDAFLADCARVLRPDGALLVNAADEPGLRWVARLLAGLRNDPLFTDHAVIATYEVLKGRRFGNIVLTAGRGQLPLDGLRRRVHVAPFPTGLRVRGELDGMTAGARPWTCADAQPSPVPPSPGSWRIR